MRLVRADVETPIGRVVVVGRDDVVHLVAFADGWARQRQALGRRFGSFEVEEGRLGATRQIERYFDGALDALSGIDLDPGGTPFQARVWRALRKIPPGETRTYGDLARRLRVPRASRAVGAANGANPISIAIPCHRLVGSTGALTGYAFGVRRKRWLLRHEGVWV